MTTAEAITVTTALLKRVGLTDWSVEVCAEIPSDVPGETIHGLAKYVERTILLRRQSMTDDVFARNVASHEVTHAFFGAGSDHDSGDFGVEWCSIRRLLDKICGAEPDMRPGCVYYCTN